MKKTQQAKGWFLKDLDIYEGISEASLCQIAPNAFDVNYPPKQQIYSPHAPDGNIYVLKRGEVILYHSKEGKRAIFDTLMEGAVFGSFDASEITPNHFAETSKPTSLCVTPVREFLEIIRRHPEAILRLMQKMAIRINDYETKIHSSLEGAPEKIYSELLRLQKKRRQSLLGKWFAYPLQVTHEKLAELTNLNRVTVTRSIKTLKKEGFILIDPKTGNIVLKIQSV